MKNNVELLKNVKFRNGIILPKYRIIVYRELLRQLKIYQKQNKWPFMCTILDKMGINHVDQFLSILPELGEQRPENAPYSWYLLNDYESRIKNVKDAIILWKKKFDK